MGRLKPTDLAPQANKDWFSEGFPAVGKEGNDRKPVPLSGKIISAHSDHKTLTLGVDYEPANREPVEESHWEGVSGAPVFSDGALVGVICINAVKFEYRRLKAVSIRHLLRDDAFCAAIGFCPLDDRRSEIKTELIRLFERPSDASRALIQILERDGLALAASAEIAAELTTNPLSALERLEKACGVLAADNHDNRRTLILAGFIVVPLLIDGAEVTALRSHLGGSEGGLAVIPAGSWTKTEVLVAAASMRQPDFASGHPSDPHGALAIDMPALGGIGDDAGTYIQSCQSFLEKKYEVPRDLDEMTKRKAIDFQIGADSKRKRAGYFVVEGKVGEDPEESVFSVVASTLKARYPGLLTVCFCQEGERYLKDLKDYESLRELVRLWMELNK